MSDLSTVDVTTETVDIEEAIGAVEGRLGSEATPEGIPTPGESKINTMPLTAALLDVAAGGISFATPGHRGGRSFRLRK